MKKIAVIGIGAGDPDYLTVQAIAAMNRADVFFVMDKGPAKDKLIALRKLICERFITHDRYRIAEAICPERRRGPADAAGTGYRAAVDDLNAEKQAVFTRLIASELTDDGCGAFLVWGDPSLYDSTIRILDAILKAGDAVFEYEVIPGITSVQALTARHRVPLNQIGRSVVITNGRTLAQGFPAGADSVVVMLDAHDAWMTVENPQDFDMYWGAYVGTADELLLSGRLSEVREEIVRIRATARAQHGWIMDSYLLHRR